MASTDLWYRRFKRSDEDDEDLLADTAFREANFKDFFGQWLQRGQNANVNSFDEIMMEFWKDSQETPPKNSFNIFCAADGGFIQWVPEKSSWLSQEVRFVAFISSDDQPFQDRSDKSWTLCIVGSSALKSTTAFLQVASWDTKTFRFYERNPVQNNQFQTPDGYNRIGWIFQGMSTNAFEQETAYLGPWNGHVNGALVMKELHKPWLHWITDNNNFVTRLSDKNQEDFLAAPYLTDQSAKTIFSGVSSAESMEIIVENGVSKWYNQRRAMDFLDSAKKPLNRPSNVKRWMSHLLLTTTTNIVPASSLNEQSFAPANHFYDEEMLSQYSKTGLMEGIDIPDFLFRPTDYDKASQKLGLALLQDVEGPAPPGYTLLSLPEGTLGGGKITGSYDTTAFIELQTGEGEGGMFTILQPSYEDAQGVLKMQSIKPGIGLVSAATFNALMMVDFWNPIYSWRRGVLMQYLPEQTSYDSASKTYDLESQLIANVKKSHSFKSGDTESPEHQFISLLDVKLEDMRSRIKRYFDNVVTRLNTLDGMIDYLTLAESRRRIFRPVPLNEFGPTLPYAVKYGHEQGARFEMTENGEIQPMDARGLRFFYKLTGTQGKGSLAGFDPSIIPEADDAATDEPTMLTSVAIMDSSMSHTPAFMPHKKSLCPFRRAHAAERGNSNISLHNLPGPGPTHDDDGCH
ncbi:hypothetical protein EPUS_06962 [Endocarpon pusillum Z07020]|uniref:Uncharacterized protein n=1 Tax=Endocarpon pusillum (strain Z07020 / HMAS-L-300199) TaxID=1263415 RepID=U1I316_ENDPU|nr:uncharacterized protein EPUS_06962 [Endocarpon pusillum Z07020]ERF76404.1 hypothetical protein EPUS_06962 [Endocarpon pusillum Z07020]